MNINSILYNIRKILKYLTFSLLIVLFVVMALLLMGKDVKANSERTYTFTDDGQNLTWTISSEGIVSVAGTLWGVTIDRDFSTLPGSQLTNYYDQDYNFYPFLIEYYGSIRFCYFRTSKNDTLYAVRDNNHNQFTVYTDSGSVWFYASNYGDIGSSVSTPFSITDYCSYPLCDYYTDTSLSQKIFNFIPINESTSLIPRFCNADPQGNEATNTLVTGETEYFWFDVPKKPDYDSYDSYDLNKFYHAFVGFHDVTYSSPPEPFYINRTTSAFADLNDYSYIEISDTVYPLFFVVADANYIHYGIPTSYFFGEYKNNTDYYLHFEAYIYGDSVLPWQKDYYWTTNFSTLGIQKQKEIAEDKVRTNINNLNEYINDTFASDRLFKLPSSSMSDPTYSFFTSLLIVIENAFLGYSDNESIELPFLGSTYTIHSTDFDIWHNQSNILREFISLFWVFAIGYYIFCDLRKRIYYMQEFHWTAMFADDITIDIL